MFGKHHKKSFVSASTWTTSSSCLHCRWLLCEGHLVRVEGWSCQVGRNPTRCAAPSVQSQRSQVKNKDGGTHHRLDSNPDNCSLRHVVSIQSLEDVARL